MYLNNNLRIMLVLKFLICLMFRFVFAGDTTVESDSVKKCQEFVCRHGYEYDTFFPVDRVKHSTDPYIVFEMNIGILAPSNGHILLSSNIRPDPSDPVYEIVVGGGANKFTELRRNLRRNAKASNRTVNILSHTEFRHFYIRIHHDGTIEFGRYSDPLPILSYYDVDPITIRYFSFAAWNGVVAKFLFDCPLPNSNKSESSSKLEPVARNLTNLQQLKKNLLYGRFPYNPPSPSTIVKFGTVITHVHFDPVDSVLTTGLTAVTVMTMTSIQQKNATIQNSVFLLFDKMFELCSNWVDDSMAWNPDKFFNITYVRFNEGQIWQPKFYVMNSVSATPMQYKQVNQPILLLNSGYAIFHFNTEVKAYCMDYNETYYSKWPRDEYSCFLVIQPWENHEHFIMTLMDDTDPQMELIAGIGSVTKNEWEWIARAKVVNASDWNQVMYNSYNDSTMHTSDRIIISLKLKRQATTYKIVFYTPLLVLITFVLMSFWTEPLKMSRVWFYVGVTMVLCMGLCYIDDLIPSSKIPFILIFYITVLSGVLIALLVQIILMTSAVKNWCNVRSEKIQSSAFLRTMFCLPKMKTCHTYETVESCSFDNETSGTIYERNMDNVEELQRDHVEYDARTILAECIDKSMFVIYSVAIAVMVAKANM